MFRSHNSDFMFVANVMYCFEISSRNLKKKRGDIFRHELHGLTLLLYSYDNTKDREFCVIRACNDNPLQGNLTGGVCP